MSRRLLALALALALLLPALPVHAGGACSIYKSWSYTNNKLDPIDLTNSFIQVGQTNMTFPCMASYSASTTQMQTVTDPYPAGAPSLATTGAGELERIRYILKDLTGWSQWYARTENLNFGARNVTTTGSITGGAVAGSTLAVGSGTTLNKITIANVGVTPTASTAAVGVYSYVVSPSGGSLSLTPGVDYVKVIGTPQQTSLCPLVNARITGTNQLTLDFAVMTAAVCTGATGTYDILVIR